MKTNPHSTTRSLVLAALFLALAFVLPMITGHVPQVGNMLCPMHFPILLCGFVLGGPWGPVGFALHRCVSAAVDKMLHQDGEYGLLPAHPASCRNL